VRRFHAISRRFGRIARSPIGTNADMATLVDQQGDIVDSIESQARAAC
jgi:hypothetical protein